MKTYLIPTTAHVAVKLSQQLLQISGGGYVAAGDPDDNPKVAE